jgi:hypothetical protein
VTPSTRPLAPRTQQVLSYLISRLRFLGALWFFITRMPSKVTVAYLSKDDPELVAIAYDYYKRLGIAIKVFLDDRTSGTSKTYLTRRGIPFQCVANPKDYVEPLYEKVAALVDTEWLMIVTNDELLNMHSLVETSLRVHFDKDKDCFAIPRSWILVRDGVPYIGRADFIGDDHQWRLVRHDAVRFHDKIHTPGFDLPDRTGLFMDRSRLYHFDWLVRSKENRKSKLDVYEAKLPGARDRYIKWYLPEDFIDDYDLDPMTEPAARKAVSEYKKLAGVS